MMPAQVVEGEEDPSRGIRTQHDVSEHLVFSHLNVADDYIKAETVPQPELDCRANLGDLVREVFSLGYRHGEWHAGCGHASAHGVPWEKLSRYTLEETGAEQTWKLFDEALRGQESMVLLHQLLGSLLPDLWEPEFRVNKRDPDLMQGLASAYHPRTCSQARSASPYRYRRHRQICRWSYADERHWAA